MQAARNIPKVMKSWYVLMRAPRMWLVVVSTQDLYREDHVSDKAETEFQNVSSHDLVDPVQV